MGNEYYLGSFEQLVLLALIRLKDNAYGMTIRREIEERSDRAVSIGAVYATLDRLEKKGYVKSRDGESGPARQGRGKRFFAIEAAGRAALEESLRCIEKLRAGLKGLGPLARGDS